MEARYAQQKSSVEYRTALVVYDSLVLQLLQEFADVVANLSGVGGATVLLLQFRNDFAEGALAVAALEDLASGALQFDRTFGEEDDAILFGTAPAASGGEAR